MKNPNTESVFLFNQMKNIFRFKLKTLHISIVYRKSLLLSLLLEQLNPELFFKVNRQLIVNIMAIKKIHSYFKGKLVIETKPGQKEKIIVGKDKTLD